MLPTDSPDAAVRHRWDIYLVLVVVCLVGNYFYVSYFGIYEDDYIYTIPALHWSWPDCWAQVRADLVAWPQGRVVAYVCNDLLTWLSAQGSSLELGYAFGAALLATNTLLCYRLAATWFPPLGAFAAAAVYGLNPADTAKVILMHRAFLLLGSTFLLTALLSYRARRHWLAYLAAALSLLTYESFFFPFLAAPLLMVSWSEFSWRRLALHGGVCTAILATVVLIRAGMGEPRIIESMGAIGVLAERMSQAVLVGPLTCLQMLIVRPLDALRYSGPTQCGLMIGLVLVTLAVFPQADTAPSGWRDVRGRLASLLLFGAGCLLLFALCYVVTIHRAYYPPVVTIGRLSAVHAPAAIPTGLLVGAIVTALAGAMNRPRVVVATLGLLVGTLVSVGLEVQRVDYVANWQKQKNYWNELLATSGEWEPGVIVLVEIDGGRGQPATTGFPPVWMANYAPLLGSWLVAAPGRPSPETDPPARVFGLYPAIKATTVKAGLQLHTPPWKNATMWPIVREGNFIYYDFADGHLARKTTVVKIANSLLNPKPIPDRPVPPWPRTDLYYFLFGPPARWPTIAGARNYPP